MSASPNPPGAQPRPDDRRVLRVVGGPAPAPRRVVVIGGGIAGLAAAHSLLREGGSQRFSVTVLEASSGLGGKLQVSAVAGIPIDEGAESMQSARPEAVTLARAVGLDRDIVHPDVFGATLWLRERLRPMPPTVMGVPTNLRALTASQVLTPSAVLRLPVEYARPATRFEHDVSVGAFVEQRLGREVVDRLVEPLLGGVYAGRADALSMAATAPALFRELRNENSLLRAAGRTARGGSRSAGARRGPVFAGIRGGIGRLPQAVADGIVSAGGEVRTGAAVRSIHRLDNRWRVIVGGAPAQVLEAEEVILAVPPNRASELLMHISPTAANDLGLIDMSTMGIIALAYPATAVPPMSGSGFLVPPSEGRLVKAANYASYKWDWIARAARTRARQADALVVIRASVGRLGDTASLERDDAELVAGVHAELVEALGIGAQPVDARVTRWHDAIPQYATGHLRRVERIRTVIAGMEGLEICGAAFDGVGVAAVIGSARVAARGVLARSERRRAARV